MTRIYLSPPHMSGAEQRFVTEAIASNWVAPLGPQVDAFEREVAAVVGVPHAAALSSGTAGLHLALLVLGVRPEAEVWCSTLTFAASANAIRYVGARPVFFDADPASWNLDPVRLAAELEAAAARNRLPAAVIVVDLYGQCADYDPILAACGRHGVPVIEDAAESLGATYRERPAGSFGTLAVLSFNGNKIVTCGGGGMLLAHDPRYTDAARKLATQARDPAPHYEHSQVGYNYRLSNVLAAVGRAQLQVLAERVAARRRVRARYLAALGDLPGLAFMPEAPYGLTNAWLTCLTLDPARFGATREDVRLALAERDIEARPVWKPMHLQPVFRGFRVVGGAVSEALFRDGLCLPSGSALTDAQIDEVAEIVREVAKRGPAGQHRTVAQTARAD